MFAILGEIQFEVLGSPEHLESSRNYDYAEHPVVGDRPHLQWIYDSLETITLELMFHSSFTDPVAQLGALRAAASDHRARALVFGNGEHRGYFIVAALSVTSRQLSASGRPIAIRARLELKEWALERELDRNAPPLPLTTPIAIVTAPPGATAAAAGQAPVAPASPLPGVSAMLNNPLSTGPSSPQLRPDDVAPRQIVRSPA